MLKIFTISALLLMISSYSCAEIADDPCTSSDEFSRVQFVGPKNAIWNYVDSDPQSWKFKLKAKNGKLEKPKSVQLSAPQLGINEEWSKYLNLSNNGEVSIAPSQIDNFIARYGETIKKSFVHRPFIEVNFTFSDSSIECQLGLGFNSMTISVPNKDDVALIRKHKLFIRIREPKGFEQISVVLDQSNKANFKGLPVGLYSPELEYNSPELSGGYADFDSVPGTRIGVDCAISLARKDNLKWLMSQNSCSKK